MMRPTNATTVLTKLYRTCVITCYDNGIIAAQNYPYIQISCRNLSLDNRPAFAAVQRLQYSLVTSNCRVEFRRSINHINQPDPPCYKVNDLNINKDNAHMLIAHLTGPEREAIKEAINKYEASQMKKTLEGQLAAFQWRTRFGRLSRVPALGDVDPTGSFCAFPEDWLRNKLVENAKPPAFSDLYRIFIVNAAPFLVFGFLDNFSMIIAGDWIESALGTFMPISTMAAAGLGNTFSDILGLGSAFYVERGCQIMGLEPPKLTPEQFRLKSSRRASNYGRLFGITVGCLIGMFPLLFKSDKPSASESTQKKTVLLPNEEKNKEKFVTETPAKGTKTQ